MKRALLIIAALALAGCGHYRTEDEETKLANSAATSWEAAEAIRIGKDPTGPVQVIQANASAQAKLLGHPYPPPSPPTAASPEKP